MSNAALAFLAGLGGGYMSEKNRQEDNDRRDKKDQRDQDEHDARMEEVKRKRDADRALREAGQPLAVNNGATVQGVAASPTVYDNADVASSDVRQANRLAELPQPAAAAGGIPGPAPAPASMAPAPVVGGKAFPDAASAEAAAGAANTPQAIRARQVQALQGIDPERAVKMEASSLQVDAARLEQAKKLRDEGVFDGLRALRAGDAAGMKEALNKSGQFKIDGDVTLTPEVREIPGVGKITTYNASFNAVGPDGKVVPRQVNSHDLSLQMMPYEKAIELAQKGTKEERDGKKSAAEIKKLEAEAGAYNALTGERNAKADAAAGGSGKPFKLDEDDKLRLTEASKGVQEATKSYGEALKVLMPGQKPEDSPAVAFAANQLKAAKLTHLRTNIELGQIKPEAMVTQILAVAKNPQDVLKSLSEIATVGGTEFSDKVATLVQQSDAWKAMNPGAKAKPATAGQPAASRMGAGAAAKRTQTEATPAPAVTAGGFPRDPNARATKVPVAVAASQGIQPPREQLVKEATTAAAAAKNAADAYRVAGLPGFEFLPAEEQIRIANMTRGN